MGYALCIAIGIIIGLVLAGLCEMYGEWLFAKYHHKLVKEDRILHGWSGRR